MRNLFARKSSRPAAGTRWDGPHTWTTDPLIGRPGFYALEADGRTVIDPPILLTHIDLDPSDEDNGAGLWVVADPDQPYYSHQPPHLNPPNLIELQAHATGSSGVSIGE